MKKEIDIDTQTLSFLINAIIRIKGEEWPNERAARADLESRTLSEVVEIYRLLTETQM